MGTYGYTFKVNGNLFYIDDPRVEKNTFINQAPQTDALPLYNDIKDKLARPVWDGHDDAVGCYYKTWELAFGNLRKANPETGHVSNFIDTAFNGYCKHRNDDTDIHILLCMRFNMCSHLVSVQAHNEK